jgi:hypothetical protein
MKQSKRFAPVCACTLRLELGGRSAVIIYYGKVDHE